MMKILSLILFLLSIVQTNINAQNGIEKDLIEKHIKAIGGEKKWNDISSLQFENKILKDGLLYSKKSFWLKDSLYFSILSYAGRDNIENEYCTIVTKDTSYASIKEKDSVFYINLSENKNIDLNQMEFLSPFITSMNPKLNILYQGIENVLDIAYHKFLILYANGNGAYVYMHPQTYLIEKYYLNSTHSEQFYEVEKYQKNSYGIWFPEQVKTDKGEMEIENLKINEKIPPQIINRYLKPKK